MYLSLSQLSHVVGLFLDRCEQASVYPRTLLHIQNAFMVQVFHSHDLHLGGSRLSSLSWLPFFQSP